MTRKDRQRRHHKRVNEQKQHKTRNLMREVRRNLNEAEITLKRRKKSVEKGLNDEMHKRGFERIGEAWRRVTHV